MNPDVSTVVTAFSKVLVRALKSGEIEVTTTTTTDEGKEVVVEVANPFQTYKTAHQYFAKLEEAHRFRCALQITRSELVDFLRVLRPNFFLSTPNNDDDEDDPEDDGVDIDEDENANAKWLGTLTPREVHAAVTEANLVNNPAVELCRLALTASPRGDTIPALYVAAFATALIPTSSLFDTLCLAMDTFTQRELCEVVRAWERVDLRNAEQLHYARQVIEAHPGITVPLLKELYPSVVSLGQLPKEFVEPPTPSVRPRTVEYNAEDGC
eukprot:PhM_4_TR15304/c0_g3_i1/m.76340